VEEKQNLYIDDALEVRVWSQVLIRSTKGPTASSLVKLLSDWVSDGLEAIRERFRSEFDGALGWSTKPEGFTLGLQVIYGTELLLVLADRGARLPVRPSELRFKLGRLLVAARERDANELWIREMERVINWAVVNRFRLCARNIGAVANVEALR
jgi:hypothetical protein